MGFRVAFPKVVWLRVITRYLTGFYNGCTGFYSGSTEAELVAAGDFTLVVS
jgi:hypothetical protein